MEKQLVMPKLQPEMKSGVLCAWLKDEGDEILSISLDNDEDSED